MKIILSSHLWGIAIISGQIFPKMKRRLRCRNKSVSCIFAMSSIRPQNTVRSAKLIPIPFEAPCLPISFRWTHEKKPPATDYEVSEQLRRNHEYLLRERAEIEQRAKNRNAAANRHSTDKTNSPT
jgi:hypothetical protein